MNCLRAVPLRALAFASALQDFIFSCWLLRLLGCAAPELRQLFMNCLRSAPDRLFALASTLQLFIFCCCAVSACAPMAAPQSDSVATRIIAYLVIEPPLRAGCTRSCGAV